MRQFSPIQKQLTIQEELPDMCSAEYDFNTVHLRFWGACGLHGSHEDYLSHLIERGLGDRFEVCRPWKEDEYRKGQITSKLSAAWVIQITIL